MSSVYKFRSNINIRQDTFSLLENKLYASRLTDLNDPFESTIIDYFGDIFKDKDGLSGLLKRIKNEVGIYSMSCDKEDKRIVLEELMWAHYANSHKGFCIEYDLDILRQSLKLGLLDNADLFEVTYDDLDIQSFALKRFQKDVKETLLSFKSPSWRYENEVRLVFDSFGVKTYDPKALKGIYFGLNMGVREREIIMKGLEGVGVTFYEMKALKCKYRLSYEVIQSNNAYMKDLLPKTMYEIIGKPEVLKTVQNFNVLYKDTDKSSNMLKYFVSKFREEYAYKPSNVTIVDDVRVIDLLNSQNSSSWTKDEEKFVAEHWIAYSTFDAPEFVWMYPNKVK